MKYLFLFLILFNLNFTKHLQAEESMGSAAALDGDVPVISDNDKVVVPVSAFFHEIGINALHSFSYNFGLNFIGAGFVTWASIASGLDWQWNRLAYNNDALVYSGLPTLYIGYMVPVLTPIGFFAVGRYKGQEKLQVAGLALAQTAVITTGIATVFKGITGVKKPGLVRQLDQEKDSSIEDYSGNFAWGFGRRGFLAGWPSGHTANAFAAAAALTEIYDDSLAIKIGAWTYAAIMGLGISVSVHWASEVFAGALIGYAVGKTVGKSFNKLLLKDDFARKPLSFYATANSIGVILRI